jgi:hypothetical protein
MEEAEHGSGGFPQPGDGSTVFILIGGVRRSGAEEMIRFYAFLTAADDDGAVRKCLESLAQQGFEEADLDQIGVLTGPPEEEEFHEPYAAAVKGEVALMLFDPDED